MSNRPARRLDWILLGFKNCMNFKGRACRSEFWHLEFYYILLLFLLSRLAGRLAVSYLAPAGSSPDEINDVFTGTAGITAFIISLIFVLPLISAGIRRLHDTNRSGWWSLLPIANIMFWCMPSQEGENRFGAAPFPASAPKESLNKTILKCWKNWPA